MLTATEMAPSTFYTIHIHEGERYLASENTKLGKLSVNSEIGKISQQQITFEVDTNGIMTAYFTDLATGNSKKTNIK